MEVATCIDLDAIFGITQEHITYLREYDNILIAQDETHSYVVSQPFTWIDEVIRSPPGGPATDAISNTFILDKSYNFTLFAENRGLSGLKMSITNTTGYEYEYRYGFRGDKEYFGEVARGSLPPGEYTIALTPYGKKGASAGFVFNVGEQG